MEDDKGPIRILCDEIGWRFDKRLERVDVLVAFVGQLVDEIETKREITDRCAGFTGKPVSEGSGQAIKAARHMLAGQGVAELIGRSKALHALCDELNPEEPYPTHPTDHLIDMLSGCASAIRFGLETPCRSRHAASAAGHVWKQVYGVSLFDSRTPEWENSWARSIFQDALVSMLPVKG